MSSPETILHVVRTLVQQAQATNQRRLVVLSGEQGWCQDTAHDVLQYSQLSSVIWISDMVSRAEDVLPANKASSLLGQERNAVVFDAHAGLDPDALGAVSGIIPGGGLLLLMCPPLLRWPELPDPAAARIAIWPYEFAEISGRFVTRVIRCLQQDATVAMIKQGESPPQSVGLSDNTVVADPAAPAAGLHEPFATRCQQDAVEAVLHMARGHRHRPLVLVSDRGRGKSSALGIAAAQLLSQADAPLRIVVTAPRPNAVITLFERARTCLPQAVHRAGYLEYNYSTLEFIAPDVLCLTELDADILLVDEAAAIPTSMLRQYLDKYSRIVFATTVHGYEGTGRGFAVRFRRVLEAKTPGWRELNLHTPIRWAGNDPLEQWIFRTLLLNADIADDEAVGNADLDAIQITRLDRDALLADEAGLSQLFGLLVVAHYRTTPNDLRNLLDGPGLLIYVVRWQSQLVATALVSTEGGFDAELADDIYAGRRRPRGHLLAQSLLAHVGLREAADLRCARIMRIAVHPALQRRGIGRRLLAHIKEAVQYEEADMLGASFGATAELLHFWMQAGLLPVRVGFHRDHASGEHSVMVITPLSEHGRELQAIARERFVRDLPHWLADPLRNLDASLAPLLLLADDVNDGDISTHLHTLDLATLETFAHGLRSYEDSLGAIWRLCVKHLERDGLTLDEAKKQLLIYKVLQQQPWGAVAEHCGLSGRAEVVASLRQAVGQLLNSVASS